MESRRFALTRYAEHELTIFGSLRDFLTTPVKNGVQEIRLSTGGAMHLLWQDRGAQDTVVYFDAALPAGKVDEYPVFSGLRLTEPHGFNYLGVSDPSFALPGKPLTGWTIGTADVDMVRLLPDVIRHLTGSVLGEGLILFGGSAGGYASLLYGARLPLSLSIALNARTDLTVLPSYHAKGAKLSFPGTDLSDLEKAIPTNVFTYPNVDAMNTVAYIQNIADSQYFEKHFLPYLDHVGPSDRVWVYMENSGEGHRMPERDYLHRLLGGIAARSNRSEWDEAIRTIGFRNQVSTQEAERFRVENLTSNRSA